MIPSDSRAHRFPVSIKGIVVLEDKLPLLKNERDEWELPGGKLEPGEDPMETVVREIAEELSVTSFGPRALDSWILPIGAGTARVEVLIVTYVLQSNDTLDRCRISFEHKELGFFSRAELGSLPMPGGYLRSIETAISLGWLAL